MKGIIGYFLFAIGLGITIKFVVTTDYSFWYSLIGFCALAYGLELIIVEEVGKIKKELNSKLDDIENEIKEINKHFNPNIKWDENGNELHFNEHVGWY